MPRSGRSFARPVAASALLHVLVLALFVWQTRSATLTAGDGTAAAGGGGGGGGGVTFIELPPYRTVARQTLPPATPEVVQVPVMVVADPVVQEPPLTLEPAFVPVAAVPAAGSGTGMGGGEGSGTGRGAGTGSGEGVGSGTGSGTGAGGSGDAVFPPQPKYSILPPLPKPASVRGQTYRVRFVVDVRGRVARVEVTPQIPDGEYRKKFLALMREYTFTPARRADGTPVRGETELAITL